MRITVSIDDAELEKAVENGISNLSTEILNDMVIKAVSEYLANPDTIANLIFKRTSYGYRTDEPRRWFIDLFARTFTEDDVKPYREKLLSTIDEHGEEITIKAMASAFTLMLLTDDAKSNIRDAIIRACNN